MTTAGDPVDVATGDVVLAQVDVPLPGILPLVIERSHRSLHLHYVDRHRYLPRLSS